MVPTPSHAFMFFTGCMLFAQMDILDGKEFYEKWFNFKETEPLNSNYELFDVNNKNFIINSGSYFPIFAGIALYEIVMSAINYLAVKCSGWYWARKVGMSVYSKSYWKNFKDGGIKLFIESYFDLAMCSLLGVLAFLEKDEQG